MRVSVFTSFYFLQQGPQITEMVIMMMEMVIGEQCNNGWKSFISHYLISYRPSYAAHTCGPTTPVYIYWYGVLVWVWFIYIGTSSLTTIIPFVEVFEFCVFLPLSPQSLAKSVIPGKANRIKAIDKYLWWLFNIYCLILLFVIVMLIVMMPYKKLMRSWFCCWLLWAFRTRLISWKW